MTRSDSYKPASSQRSHSHTEGEQRSAPSPIEDYEGRRIRAQCAHALFGEQAPDLLRIDRFRLTGTLGRGGQGVVFRAVDPKLDREVALKLLASGADRTDHVLHEAQILARISHDNVVKVFEAGLDRDGRPFIVMDLIQGVDLGTWLAQRARRWDRVIDAFILAGRGLAAIHQQGVVHRDFKPRNVLVADDGSVKVVDFGIAASPAPDHGSDILHRSPLVGTIPYMAPEQRRGGTPDALGDQYSFCVALYEALYGRSPASVIPPPKKRGATTTPSQAQGHSFGVHGRVPGYFRSVLDRGLRHDPSARHRDMAALLDALSRGPWWRRTIPRASLLMGLGACVAVVVGIAWPRAELAPCRAYASAVTEWNEHRGRIAETIKDGNPPLVKSFQTTDSILTLRAEQLDAEITQACSALALGTADTPDVYRRLECLEYNRGSLTRIFQAISSAEPDELVSIPDRLVALQELDDCQRPREAIESCDPWEVLDGHEQVSSEFDERLAVAAAAAIRGDYDHALTLGEEAVELASDPALRPRRARAHLERGRLAFDSQQLDLAVGELKEARHLAELEGCDRLGAETLVLLSKALVLQRGDHAAAAGSWSTLALDKLDRVGSRGRALAAGLSARGMVSNLAEGRPSEADDYIRQAIEIQREFQDESRAQLELSHMLLNRGSTLARLGRMDDAIAALEQGIEIRARLLGDEHPTLEKLYYQLGLRQTENGEFEASEHTLNRALSVLQKGLPRSLRRQGDIHMALTRLHEQKDDLTKALEHARKASRAYETGLPADHLLRSDALQAEGSILLGQDKAEDALPLLEKSLQITERSPDATPRDRGIATFKLGRAHAQLERWEHALELHEEAVEMLRHTKTQPRDDTFARASFYRAEALLNLGRADEAGAPLEAAIAIWEPMNDMAEMLALSLWLLGKSRCLEGHQAEGRSLARTALDYFEQAPESSPNSRYIADITEWISSPCSSQNDQTK